MGLLGRYTYDNAEFMVRMLGSVWGLWFPEHSTVTSLMTSRTEPFYQSYLGLLELVACKSRFDIPVFQTRFWSQLTVKESEKNSGAQMYNLYDTSGLVYQSSTKPAYGDKENNRYFSYAIDPQVKYVHAVYNRIINPSLIWMNNADFVVDGDRHVISFYTDPFEDPLVPKRVILDSSGNVVDREIQLWLSLAGWDMQYIYEQFGYALGIWMKSSTFYKEFISAIWDSLVLGPTELTLKLAFSALTGIPFAGETETVVRIIDESPVYKHVETDKNIYTFKASTTIIVTPGQILNVGDPMCSSLLFIEPEYAAHIEQFPGLAIGKDLTRPDFAGPIVFGNAEVPVQYMGLDPNGKSIVQFQVDGFPRDVQNFWQRSHREGLKANNTMADVLDTRAVRASPTTPADLPATINPFQFAMDHIFINNMYLVYINPRDFAAGSPGLGALDLLYAYLPPHTTYVIFVEIQQNTEYYNLEPQADSLGFFKGATINENAGEFVVDRGPTIRSIPGRCR